MGRALHELSIEMKAKSIELLARACELGIPVMIIQTGRTMEEHQANLARGVSWIKLSKHLSRSIRGIHMDMINMDKADAIDICPYETFSLHGPDKLEWDVTDPIWFKLGLLGESLGLRWGGRWEQKDMGHFELPF